MDLPFLSPRFYPLAEGILPCGIPDTFASSTPTLLQAMQGQEDSTGKPTIFQGVTYGSAARVASAHRYILDVSLFGGQDGSIAFAGETAVFIPQLHGTGE